MFRYCRKINLFAQRDYNDLTILNTTHRIMDCETYQEKQCQSDICQNILSSKDFLVDQAVHNFSDVSGLRK